MKFNIAEDIVRTATKCKSNYSCLSGQEECFCKVEDCAAEKVHFIKPVNSGACDYKVEFGYSFMCNCPVRKEIYNHYKA